MLKLVVIKVQKFINTATNLSLVNQSPKNVVMLFFASLCDHSHKSTDAIKHPLRLSDYSYRSLSQTLACLFFLQTVLMWTNKVLSGLIQRPNVANIRIISVSVELLENSFSLSSTPFPEAPLILSGEKVKGKHGGEISEKLYMGRNACVRYKIGKSLIENNRKSMPPVACWEGEFV